MSEDLGYVADGDFRKLLPGKMTAETAMQAADALLCSLVRRPRHASTMHSIQLRYSEFGPTVRLALRWLAGHCFGEHVDKYRFPWGFLTQANLFAKGS